MDIDDILAQVDDLATPRETLDLQELTRAWVIERSAPEILPWPQTLIERILEKIRRQVNDFSQISIFSIFNLEDTADGPRSR